MQNYTVLDTRYELYGDCGLFHTAMEHGFSMKAPHYHNDYEFYFLIKGNRKYFLANKICDLTPGDVLLIKNGEPHQATLDTDLPYERYLIHITPKLMHTICKEYRELADFVHTRSLKLKEETRDELMEIIHLLKKEFDTRDDYSESMIKNHITRILLLLHRAANQPGHEVALTEKNDIRLQNSINYILEHYSENITLEQCAKIAYMSPSHFSRLFHQLTSLSFKEYLNKIRIEKACEILQQRDVSITELALNVGFNSSSYFSQVFKSIAGTSPVTYRKNKRK